MHASSLLSISLMSFTVIQSIGVVATVDPSNEEGQPKWRLKVYYRRIESMRAKITKGGCYTGEFIYQAFISIANTRSCESECHSLANKALAKLLTNDGPLRVTKNLCMAQSKAFKTLYSAVSTLSANHGCHQCACKFSLTLSSIFKARTTHIREGKRSPKSCDLEGVGDWLQAYVGDAQLSESRTRAEDASCEAFQKDWPQRRCINGRCEKRDPEGQWIQDQRTCCEMVKNSAGSKEATAVSEIRAISQRPKKQKKHHTKQDTCSTRPPAIDETTTCLASAAPVDGEQSSSAAARTEAQNRLSEEEAFLSNLPSFFEFDDPNFDF